MGSLLGKITVETPKFQLLKSTTEYEIRKYSPCVVAQVTYDPSQTKGDRDGGFSILASYIGVIGQPQNTKPEKIAMTAPVITSTESETIAMTAPVVTKSESSGQSDQKKLVTMQFVLPSEYTKAEEAPKPTDERVVIKEEGGKTYGVIKFSGVATDAVVEEKVEKLKKSLEKDSYKVIGGYLLARYNPPWTLPPLRTNEIMIPIELVEST
ncbi:hypothetical protein IFM89_035177 [Coptis chinensis]|uniref:SOUL heme-binding family protein n=1 Tax=Coptis chinensis TaxID=261450 RepID=A0A835IKC4_9MAGN|nr:hypothetical protein IFM89_005708 [Coptis chinensis]KAF9617233.1 hypothetical protein IFM89_035177 [Coptis chinensis]